MLNEVDKVIVRMAAHIAALEQALPQLQEKMKSAEDEAKSYKKQLEEATKETQYMMDKYNAIAAEQAAQKAEENHV